MMQFYIWLEMVPNNLNKEGLDFTLKKYKLWNAGYLRCKKCICFTGWDFHTFIYIGVAQREYVVLQNTHLTCFYKPNAAVAE